MNIPYGTTPAVIDLDALDQFNAGTRKAVRANQLREAREKFLDSMYIYNERPER